MDLSNVCEADAVECRNENIPFPWRSSARLSISVRRDLAVETVNTNKRKTQVMISHEYEPTQMSWTRTHAPLIRLANTTQRVQPASRSASTMSLISSVNSRNRSSREEVPHSMG